MKLSKLMNGTGARAEGGDDPDIALVTSDSREVRGGSAFFALPGSRQDGHDFAAEAARRGATVVVAEHSLPCSPARLLLAPSTRRAMAIAAANFFERPGDAMTLAGVTGTNGKTTVAWLLESCLQEAGHRAGLVGTVVHRWPGAEERATHTTPESTVLEALLRRMRNAGVETVVLEVSSHALALERVAGLRFKVAGFTNLTRDHLDFHHDMDRYYETKRRLFSEHLAPDGLAVVNARDPAGARLADELGPGRRVLRYGVRAEDPMRAEEVSYAVDGIRAVLATPEGPIEIHSPLVGSHNLENLLCAAGMALGLGLSPGDVGRALTKSEGAPGRLERVAGKKDFSVFVDYAHTDDALARALKALRPLVKGRLFCLFGCGGDRDRGKRPLMGRAAASGSNLTVVTSDNPRTEDPGAIIQEIVAGIEGAGASRLTVEAAREGKSGYLLEPDRRAAISLAISLARPGDVVLLAGKGHEDYQILGDERRPFSDREEAQKALGFT